MATDLYHLGAGKDEPPVAQRMTAAEAVEIYKADLQSAVNALEFARVMGWKEDKYQKDVKRAAKHLRIAEKEKATGGSAFVFPL
jgi:hypothetical protein